MMYSRLRPFASSSDRLLLKRPAASAIPSRVSKKTAVNLSAIPPFPAISGCLDNHEELHRSRGFPVFPCIPPYLIISTSMGERSGERDQPSSISTSGTEGGSDGTHRQAL